MEISWVTSNSENPKSTTENPIGDITSEIPKLTEIPWATSLSEFPRHVTENIYLVSLNRFALPAFEAPLLTRRFWHVPIGNLDLIKLVQAAPQWCARSPSVMQSAICNFGPQGLWTFVPTQSRGHLHVL